MRTAWNVFLNVLTGVDLGRKLKLITYLTYTNYPPYQVRIHKIVARAHHPPLIETALELSDLCGNTDL